MKLPQVLIKCTAALPNGGARWSLFCHIADDENPE
jgi:hypothetical protein